MSTYKTFEELDCWQKCRRVRLWVYHFLIKNFSQLDEDLVQNLKRASRSSTRNIAEGFGRFYFKDNIRFCRIALGSLFELKDDILICVDEKRVEKKEIEHGLKLILNAIISVKGYINYLKASTNK